ncbi:MAG: DUF3160 domain-containing protein, partial [Ignavibacteriae bacterium]|nr:DUF3160 domain-containing protein [Ignavibacteriota bacterium]
MNKIILMLMVVVTCGLFAQTNSFDVNAYKSFLSSHQDLTTEQLLGLHPAGTFSARVLSSSTPPLYLDSIQMKLHLTADELSLINQHGFMVSERLHRPSFGNAYEEIWINDLPVFVSTDALLHALHMSFDRLLMDIEVVYLYPKLKEVLSQLHQQIPALAIRYVNDTSMNKMLKDVDVYLTVPRILLGETVTPYFSTNVPVVNELMTYIDAEQPDEYPLFQSENKTIDFSQFTVRGHYTNEEFPELAKYFKAMIWLGRTEMYLLAPQNILLNNPSKEDIQRQAIDAVLISEAVTLANARAKLDSIDNIIELFVGESDNVTLSNVQELISSVNLTQANELLDTLKLQAFQDSLKTKSYAFQRILSQILYNNPLNPDSIVPASAFLLLGQRFIVDSYITGQVVYDRIEYHGTRVTRMLPSTLDVLYGLGNDAAAQLLQPELDTYHYGTNLAAVRYLVDSYDSSFWNLSLYNKWLTCIRTLNPPTVRNTFPEFMQTAAWWQQKMNTQLSSWAELRHDVLLYAKQSYSGGITCSYPYSYVEPIPAFYDAMKSYAQAAKGRLLSLPFPSYYLFEVTEYLNNLEGVSETLGTIARKELDGDSLTNDETTFLSRMFFYADGCGEVPEGWYFRLFFNGEYGFYKTDYLVADVHTAPTDEVGNPIGWVKHAGTGKVNLGVFVADHPSGQKVAFVGPAMSYHEYTTTNFQRLTDEEWAATYLSASLRPPFVNLYLADSSGTTVSPGINLTTEFDSLTISTIENWNLVSLPVRVSNSNKDSVFFEAQSSAYTYREGYVTEEFLQVGSAYWLKFPSDMIQNFSGQQIYTLTIFVQKGWNLVGSISTPVSVSSITSVPAGIPVSPFYEYNAIEGYRITDTIKPG